MTAGRVAWFRGFFSVQAHAAVVLPRPAMVFRRVPILWSICGVPVAAAREDRGYPRCVECQTSAQDSGFPFESQCLTASPAGVAESKGGDLAKSRRPKARSGTQYLRQHAREKL